MAQQFSTSLSDAAAGWLLALKQRAGQLGARLACTLKPAREGIPEIALIARSGLFDEHWYLQRYPVAAASGPIAHYVQVGSALGNPPHPLFDQQWYCLKNSDVVESGLTPLGHFIVLGEARGASPHPLFDPGWYRRQSGVPLLIRGSPFRHFLQRGGMLGISPHPLFDGRWYIDQDPALAAQNINPLTHFVECGALQGRWPNPYFDVSWYYDTYRDVHGAGINALVHFALEGAVAGHKPHPGIDLDEYIRKHPVIVKDRLSVFVHLVRSKPSLSGSRVVDGKTMAGAASQMQAIMVTREQVEKDCRLTVDLDGRARAFTIEDRLPELATPTAEDVAGLVRMVSAVDVVSFDVWDTLLRRDCHPDEIKLQSARALLLLASRDLRPAFRDLHALFKARLAAESDSAPNKEFEYRFEDALILWFRTVLRPGSSPALVESLHEALREHERAAEIRSSRPDALGREVLTDHNGPRVFASDFYLSETSIRAILDAHGLSKGFLKGYVSSDTYQTKRSGRLFERMLQDLALEPAQLAHVGDHAISDVELPNRKGIRGVRFQNDGEERRRAWHEVAFSAWCNNDLEPHWRRMLALCEDIASGFGASHGGLLRATGARLAPLVAGFGLSVIEEVLSRDSKRAYFFAREGIFFKRVHDALLQANPYNMKTLPEGRVLMVSRRATFAASLREFSVQELMRIWSLYGAQSPKAFSLSLNLDDRITRQATAAAGLDFDAPVKAPSTDRRFRAMLEDALLAAHARQRIDEQRESLSTYLHQEGFHESSSSFIVDIGWRGTIQDALALLDGSRRIHGHYLGLFGFLNRQPANVSKSGWLFDENEGRALPISDVAVLEMIFNAPGGSAIGYTGTECMIPVLDVHADEEDVISHEVALLQEGILGALTSLINYIRLHGLMSGDVLPLARRIAKALVQRPPAVLADTFFKLHHNETFGMGGLEALGAGFDPRQLLRSVHGAELHAALQEALKRTRWREGALCQSPASEWWGEADIADRRSVPTEFALAQGPAAVKALGSRVTVYAPSPLAGSGGHRTIYSLVRRLHSIGLNVDIHLEGVGDGVDIVESYLAGTPASLHMGWKEVRPSDMALATIAHSAKVVAQSGGARFRSYLVQDFEALFNPMSDGYLVAENSYLLGLQHYTIGNWLTHVLNLDYGAAACPAGLGVDTSVYGQSCAQVQRELAVCFLYQPDKPRRAPALGIEALRMVKQEMPEARIYIYGSDLPVRLDFEVENMGLIRDLSSLGRLYARCTAGLCISGTNPSRIPYEMMAAGCVPVDLYRYNNLLDHEPGTIVLAHQSAASITAALLTLLRNPTLAGEFSAAARRRVAARTLAWEVDVLCNSMLMQMEGVLPARWPVCMTYCDSPYLADTCKTKGVLDFCENQRTQALRQVR